MFMNDTSAIKKKYVFVITYWSGGGTEKVFEEISKILLEHNREVYLFVLYGVDTKKYYLNEKIKIISKLSEFRKLVKSNRNTTVVNFSGDWKSSFVTLLATRNYVSWVHCNPLTMKTARTSLINFHILKKSRKLVCVCKEQRDILIKELGFKNAISVIYNAVDFDYVKKKSTETLDFGSEYFLMVARIDFKSKDFFTVIDAYSLLPENIQQKYKMVFLGDGDDKQIVHNYIKQKGLTSRVILRGFDSNPYKWFKNAKCNILSSRTEGFSVSVIEGMAIGCPEIITNYRTSAREVSDNGKNAVLVEIGDSVAMNSAILHIVLDDEYREELIKNASTFVNNFSKDAFGKQILAFFEEKSV